MALIPLNSIAGFSTGRDANTVVDANANVTANNLSVTGLSNLNDVANVSITGGFNGQVLTTDGNGNLSWQTVTSGASDYILYVSVNGSDSNDGSIAQPFLTIKHAMAQAAILSNNGAKPVSVHVAPGSYIEDNPITIPRNVALMGDNLRNVFITPMTPAADFFYVTSGCYVWGITIRNYLGNGFSFDPSTPTQNVFVSPYIQNLTSSTTTGTAVYIDGSKVSANSTKAMIVGFFTIINRGGKGIHIVNTGYSQLVNIYTIACDVGIWCESGAFCTLNGSDCSIGNYGLKASGYGPIQTTGTIVSQYQGVFVIDNLTNGTPNVNTIMVIDGDPNYYTIDTIFPNTPEPGKATVVIQQVYVQDPAPGTPVTFYVRSSIIASAHTFEYVGAGTNPATALPQYGGIPIPANEVIQEGGGVVTYTSTDQKGNFKVGDGFTISQATGTITGTYYYQSLFAQMTPFILALGSE